MKKLLTLGNVLKACALVFALVAFFMMFTDQVFLKSGNMYLYFKFDDALFGDLGDHGAPISFVGYLLVLIAGLAVCALVFLPVDAKIKRFIGLGLALVLVLGAVFVLIEAAVINGDRGSYQLTAGPVVAGILAILAGLLTAASEFVPAKQLVK